MLPQKVATTLVGSARELGAGSASRRRKAVASSELEMKNAVREGAEMMAIDRTAVGSPMVR